MSNQYLIRSLLSNDFVIDVLCWTPSVGPLMPVRLLENAAPTSRIALSYRVCCCCGCGYVGNALALSKRSVISTATPPRAAGIVAPDCHRRPVRQRLGCGLR